MHIHDKQGLYKDYLNCQIRNGNIGKFIFLSSSPKLL